MCPTRPPGTISQDELRATESGISSLGEVWCSLRLRNFLNIEATKKEKSTETPRSKTGHHDLLPGATNKSTAGCNYPLFFLVINSNYPRATEQVEVIHHKLIASLATIVFSFAPMILPAGQELKRTRHSTTRTGSGVR